MVKIKIRDLGLKHAGWQDEAAVSSPVKWYEINSVLENNNQRERERERESALLLGSGHESERYYNVLRDSMPANGRFEARIVDKEDAQDASHDIFRPTSRFNLFSVLAHRSIGQIDFGLTCIWYPLWFLSRRGRSTLWRFKKGSGRNAVQLAT
jgi:hypothetical protein